MTRFFSCEASPNKGNAEVAQPFRFQYAKGKEAGTHLVRLYGSFPLNGTFTFTSFLGVEADLFRAPAKPKGTKAYDHPETECHKSESHLIMDVTDTSSRLALWAKIAVIFLAGQHPVFVQKGFMAFLLAETPSSKIIDTTTWTAAPDIRDHLQPLHDTLLAAVADKDEEVKQYSAARYAVADYILTATDPDSSDGQRSVKEKHATNTAKTFYKTVFLDKVTAKVFDKLKLSIAHMDFEFPLGDALLPVGQAEIYAKQ